MIIRYAHFSELAHGENAVLDMLFRFAAIAKRKFACKRRERK
jgi:hypothetical protein